MAEVSGLGYLTVAMALTQVYSTWNALSALNKVSLKIASVR